MIYNKCELLLENVYWNILLKSQLEDNFSAFPRISVLGEGGVIDKVTTRKVFSVSSGQSAK